MKYIVEHEAIQKMMDMLAQIYTKAHWDVLNIELGKILQQAIEKPQTDHIPLEEGDEEI